MPNRPASTAASSIKRAAFHRHRARRPVRPTRSVFHPVGGRSRTPGRMRCREHGHPRGFTSQRDRSLRWAGRRKRTRHVRVRTCVPARRPPSRHKPHRWWRRPAAPKSYRLPPRALAGLAGKVDLSGRRKVGSSDPLDVARGHTEGVRVETPRDRGQGRYQDLQRPDRSSRPRWHRGDDPAGRSDPAISPRSCCFSGSWPSGAGADRSPGTGRRCGRHGRGGCRARGLPIGRR
jgi:hypothetical protein